jgi:ribonuclease P protein component
MLKKEYRYSFTLGIPGRAVHCPFFVLRFQKNNHAHARFAIVVSKKIDAHSVYRNKIKRMYSAVIAGMLDTIEPIDAIFYVRRPSRDATADDIQTEIQKIFRKEGIIK